MLSIKDLKLHFPTANFTAVDGISFDIKEGEILALVGESGSGKSLTAKSILGLQPVDADLTGSIDFHGQELLVAKYPAKIRGNRISLVPQDSLSAFNPVYKVGAQLIEAIDVYQPDLSAEEKQAKVLELFAKVGIPEPERSFNAYPHEISGGMRQRALIAMALINEPDLIIADEPTTALDVTVQSMVLDLLKSLNKTILFITHDLGVVAEIADRVVVMRHGKIVESNDVFDLFENPREDYTKDLLAHCL